MNHSPAEPAEPAEIDPTEIECPTCGAWIGWACEGPNYGYHAAGYHRKRYAEARRLRTERSAETT